MDELYNNDQSVMDFVNFGEISNVQDNGYSNQPPMSSYSNNFYFHDQSYPQQILQLPENTTELNNQDFNLIDYVTEQEYDSIITTDLIQKDLCQTSNLQLNSCDQETINDFDLSWLSNNNSSTKISSDSPIDTSCITQKKHNKSLSVKKNRPCEVCGHSAGKNTYYGGQVCNSCHAFFRRAVTNESYFRFVCLKNDDCKINSRSWKSCQSCRFKKCLECGMIISRVTDSMQDHNGSKIKIKNNNETSLRPFCQYPKDIFTMDDEIYIVGMRESAIKLLMEKITQDQLRDLDLMELVFMQMANSKPLSPKMLKIHEKSFFSGLNEFFGNLRDTSSISEKDRMALMRANFHSSLCYFYSHAFGNDNYKRFEPMFKQMVQKFINPFSLDNKYKYLRTLWNWSAKEVSYEQVFPPNWTKNTQAADRHKKLCYKIRQWGRISQNLADENLIFLLGIIILFSPDSVKLENPQSVENLQQKFVILLTKYLKTNFKNQSPTYKFGNGIMLSSHCREIYDIGKKHSIA